MSKLDAVAKSGSDDLTQRCANFSQFLLGWDNPSPGRNLPWAFESDPYKVWVSEIMLQQTQAATVVPYYLTFIQRFSSVQDLADASLDEVLKHWTGLGYYSRARNLHQAAQLVRDQYQGVFPESFDKVLALPGVGRSTAGAICALAYGKKTPILDGNAKRVYARCFCVDDGKDSERMRKYWVIAEASTPDKNSQKFTQFIMDIGATVCTPKNPRCEKCPVESLCCARKADLVEHFPIKKQSAKRKIKSTTMIMVIDESHRVLLERRPSKGIWGGLWSFPEYGGQIEDTDEWLSQQYAMQILDQQLWETFHHDFTHYRLNITPVLVRVEDMNGHEFIQPGAEFVNLNKPIDRGLPAPVVELIERIRNEEVNRVS